jgi:hypothetical protein
MIQIIRKNLGKRHKNAKLEPIVADLKKRVLNAQEIMKKCV